MIKLSENAEHCRLSYSNFEELTQYNDCDHICNVLNLQSLTTYSGNFV